MIYFAEFFPPISPSLNSAELAPVLLENMSGIRIGMGFLLFSAGFYMMFVTVMAHYVSIVERHIGVLTLFVAFGGAINLVLFSYPAGFWLTAVYRVERSPELIQLMHDAAWLPFMGMVVPTLIMYFAIAVVAFLDRREHPLFPRWFGYFNLFGITVYLPGQLIYFFRDGVFAWSGLVGFWLPAVDFFSQHILCIIFLWIAVRRAKENAANAP